MGRFGGWETTRSSPGRSPGSSGSATCATSCARRWSPASWLRTCPRAALRVLDVGAGQGTQALRLARLGHSITAVEPDERMRAGVRSRPPPVSTPSRGSSDVTAGGHRPRRAGRRDGADGIRRRHVPRRAHVPPREPAPRSRAWPVASRRAASCRSRPATVTRWRGVRPRRHDWAAALGDARRGAAGGRGGPRRPLPQRDRRRRPRRHPRLAHGNDCEAAGLEVTAWYGIRVASDDVPVDEPAPEGAELAALLGRRATARHDRPLPRARHPPARHRPPHALRTTPRAASGADAGAARAWLGAWTTRWRGLRGGARVRVPPPHRAAARRTTTDRSPSATARPTPSRAPSPTCCACSTCGRASGCSTSARAPAGRPPCSATSSARRARSSGSSSSQTSPRWGAENLARAGMPWATIRAAEPGVLGGPAGAPWDRILVSAEAGTAAAPRRPARHPRGRGDPVAGG